MSGIVGIVGDVEELEYRLAAMLRRQEHRGDHERGFWVSSFVESRLGLAHCGVVVSETEENVRQPYVDEELQLVIVLDGDIYNYRALRETLQPYGRFTTDSSVEVVAKAYRRWGEECFQRLEGVFALVIFDRQSDMLLMARDRYGEKPFYYSTYQGNLYFASEVRSLFAAGVPLSLSSERWAGYMLYSSYGPAYSTFWEEVSQLPAGCLMRYNGYSLSEKCWYSLRDDVLALMANYSVDEMQFMFATELRECVNRSMADVSSCGLRVAGRVESQVLHSIAMQGKQRWKVHTFTGDVDNIGRQPLASPVWVTATHALNELEEMQHWVEEPFDGCETVVRTAMFRYARRNGMRMVCSGVGLDVLWQDVWDNAGIRHNYFHRHPLFSPLLAQIVSRPSYEHYFFNDADNMRYLELFSERLPHMLRFFDRSAAEVGVSVRMPFLDGHLVALSFALPLASKRCRKALFEHYIEAYHQGAVEHIETMSILPLWLSGGFKEWVDDALADLSRSVVREWFDMKQLEALRRAFGENAPIDAVLLWKCLSLQRQLGEM